MKTTNHEQGNCTANRMFVLIRISFPLAGHGDPAEHSQHPLLTPHICLAERGRSPDFSF